MRTACLSCLILVISFASIFTCTTGCVKKVTTVIQNYPRSITPNTLDSSNKTKINTTSTSEETAAELANDESVYTKYSHQTKEDSSSRFYLEVEESLDKTLRVYKMTTIPPIYSQIMNNHGKESNATIVDEETSSKINNNDFEEITIENEEQRVPEPPPVESLIGEDQEDPDPLDEIVRKDWGGDCDVSHWNYCNKLQSISVMNVFNKTEGKDIKWISLDMDCVAMKPTLCLRNKWTANKCHLICMSKCNRDILIGYDVHVSHEGACKYV